MEQVKIINREIKFRAKTVAGNRWVYGDLITKPIHYDCVILENGVINHSVIPETVGQYTGLKDKSGKEIYEGDLLHLIKNGFQDGEIWEDEKCAVKWETEEAAFLVNKAMPFAEKSSITWYDEYTVIGNIYELASLF